MISANDEGGIWIIDAGTTGVVVEHNFIGTDVTGTKPLGNTYSGVGIAGGAANTTIGGTTAGAGNVISANREDGIWITGAGTTGVAVQHNFIGTDVTGTKPLGNTYDGVEIDGGAANTTIGGTTADAGNVISANGGGRHLDHRRWDHRGRRPAQFHRHRRHRYEAPWETRTPASRSTEAR